MESPIADKKWSSFIWRYCTQVLNEPHVIQKELALMSPLQFYLLFPSLFMLHELEEIIWMPSFIKKLSTQFPNNRILSYYTPFAFNAIVLEQFLILLLSLFLSYWFNNYTIYTTIVIAYIYHVFGHLIQTIVLRNYVPGLLTGILTSWFSLYYLNPNI